MSEREPPRALVARCARLLIPGDDDFPAADQLPVAETVLRALDQRKSELLGRLFAYLASNQGGGVAELLACPDDRLLALLRDAEREQPAAFSAFLEAVYYVYYAQPEVLQTLRRLGYDVNDAPLPRGYAMAPWAEGEVPVTPRGGYLSTEQVAAIDPQLLPRLFEDARAL